MSVKNEIVSSFGGKIRIMAEGIDDRIFEEAEEIRIRADRPSVIKLREKTKYITPQGILVDDDKKAFYPEIKDIAATMEILSGYSLYAFSEEVKKGFITISGGHRIGIAGHTVTQNDCVVDIRHINSLNIRISHEIKGCANIILPYIFNCHSVMNTIIISPPGCGKTTLLRDLTRLISNSLINVSVVDERSEIGGTFRGKRNNDCGKNTDVLDGCPKTVGMKMLLRSMAPDCIVVDEIGEDKDIDAIEEILNCGVAVICTVHGATIKDVLNRTSLKRLTEIKAFDRYVFLHNKGKTGRVEEVLDENLKVLWRDE
ncbi:MAG TPA: stage III sporulation protein AA [Lachnospiraceae bacterium]|nr:stage III sporulation protein AA [Lachnospiraceae bacterium]